LIKRFIRRVLRLDSTTQPETIPFKRHGIQAESLSRGARQVCQTLQAKGYQAYVVGGAVRDLLLGVKPKDFDVATDADPEEVHKLFRRSRLIGRRFKIVHVMFGEETVEVSTFRAGTGGEADEHGRVLRDNVFGNREQDAARRDFTCNAMYFDPAELTVFDYHRGYKDVQGKTVRIIGDARLRYREDPVRMLRAVRFAAKLGFHIHAQTSAPIRELAPLLENVPAARMFDEMQKLLLSGHAVACLKRLRSEGLHHGVLPMLDVILEQPMGERFVMLALAQTDERVREDRPVSPAFLFASLLWHEVLASWTAAKERGERPIPALHDAMDNVLALQTDKLAIPRRFTAMMKEIWILQPRFEQRSGRRPHALLAQERFRAAYDFLELRAQSGEVPTELAEWWTEFQDVTPERREDMLQPQSDGDHPKRKRRRRKPGAGASAQGNADSQ
jgi:poly(A) polymerase